MHSVQIWTACNPTLIAGTKRSTHIPSYQIPATLYMTENRRQCTKSWNVKLYNEKLYVSQTFYFMYTDLQGHSKSILFLSHLKERRPIRFPISDYQQPIPYLAQFSHNASVTDEQTDRRQSWHRGAIQHSCNASKIDQHSKNVPKLNNSHCKKY